MRAVRIAFRVRLYIYLRFLFNFFSFYNVDKTTMIYIKLKARINLLL